jgi:uncharacterized protein (DUF1697 family)
MMWTFEGLRQILHASPFPREGPDATGIHVTFLPGILLADLVQIPTKGADGFDRYVIIGSEVHLFCPEGYGRTKFTTTFFEKNLGVAATTRNWKTVNALTEMAGK